jgi:hypothetical protein
MKKKKKIKEIERKEKNTKIQKRVLKYKRK